MLRSTKEMRGYELVAQDGQIGKVHELLFDDEAWTVRYLVANTGSWLTGRLVLLAPQVVGEPAWDKRSVRVRLTCQQVEDSPDIDADKPVSRQRQVELHTYYGWPMYWAVAPEPGIAVPPVPETKEAEAGQAAGDDASAGDEHLRSTRQVDGYRIHARDGDIGHVSDFIVDDGEWIIRYLVVDTGNWLPGRKVLVAPTWVEQVRWAEAAVHVDLDMEQIEKSPEYDPSTPINRQYEERLYDFLGRPKYW